MKGCLTNALPALAWVLAAAALVVFVMATPGQSGTTFADGWSIGFVATIGYLVVYPVLLLAGLLMRSNPPAAKYAGAAAKWALVGWIVAMIVAVGIIAG